MAKLWSPLVADWKSPPLGVLFRVCGGGCFLLSLVYCHDSVDTSFYSQTFTMNGSGGASDSTLCHSPDGPDHWVTGGGVKSNHVTWG